MNRITPQIAAVLLIAISWSSFAHGSDATDSRIRQRAEQILSGGEFRYLNRIGGEAGDGSGGRVVEDRRREMEDAQQQNELERQRQEREAKNQRNRWEDADLEPVEAGETPAASGAAGVIGTVYTGVAWAFLAIVIAGILFLIIRALANMDSSPKVSSSSPELNEEPVDLQMEAPPGATPADVFLDRARQLAKSGKFREAVAHLLMGAMSNIERSGLLRFRQGLTLRDYLRAVRQLPGAHTGLRAMIRIYEPIGFGRREATRKHFELTLVGYQEGFADALAVQNG